MKKNLDKYGSYLSKEEQPGFVQPMLATGAEDCFDAPDSPSNVEDRMGGVDWWE